MEYEIIFADSTPALVQTVGEYLAEGWEPHGGVVVVVYTGGGIRYIQALVRRKSDRPWLNER